jgi:hypothetical protein
MGEIDSQGHALGGPWRFAAYAPYDVATCINNDHLLPAPKKMSSCTGTPATAADVFEMAGCFVSDGGSYVDPWADGSMWVDSTWEDCHQKALAEGHSQFVMEGANNYEAPGHASCGHSDVISIESAGHSYHDAGHNGNGRAPDSDCLVKVDEAHHGLGGPYRFAVYTPHENALCIQESVGDAVSNGANDVSSCIPPEYVTQANNQWMYVGCFVSNADGGSHADPWADGTSWLEASWSECQTKAEQENTGMFVMEGSQQYDTVGHASCGHMNAISHGNYYEHTADDGFNIGEQNGQVRSCYSRLSLVHPLTGAKFH